MIIKKPFLRGIIAGFQSFCYVDFSAKQRGEDIFQPTNGNKVLHQDSS